MTRMASLGPAIRAEIVNNSRKQRQQKKARRRWGAPLDLMGHIFLHLSWAFFSPGLSTCAPQKATPAHAGWGFSECTSTVPLFDVTIRRRRKSTNLRHHSTCRESLVPKTRRQTFRNRILIPDKAPILNYLSHSRFALQFVLPVAGCSEGNK